MTFTAQFCIIDGVFSYVNMKKLFYCSFVLLFLFAPFVTKAADAPQKVEFVLFHSKTCSHCKAEIDFIDKKLRPEYSDKVDFQLYEVSENQENQQMLSQYLYYYKGQGGSVPITFIDGEIIYGYGDDKTSGAHLKEVIEQKLRLKGWPDGQKTDVVGNTGEQIIIPMIGAINPRTFSLPLLTVIVGLLDVFNPCAVWVLLFLISLLLGMENRKRMILLGSIFILASGAVYFVFMTTWLHFILFIGMIFWVRLIIGATGIGVGSKNLWDYWKNRKAEGVVCEVSQNKSTQTTFEKIKNIVHRQGLWWSILGIILLGFSVNLVEMACSAGFPAIYTQVLALNGTPMWQKYLYMLGYIFFYMLDDLIVFIIAVVTLKSRIVGGKFAKYSNLIGGALILILGALLILKPEWLMFS